MNWHVINWPVVIFVMLFSGCSESSDTQSNRNSSADAQGSRFSSDEQMIVSEHDLDSEFDTKSTVEGLALIRTVLELVDGEADDQEALVPENVKALQEALSTHIGIIIKEFDANGNGRIDAGAERRALADNIKNKLKKQALEKFDTNDNGKLDREEIEMIKEDLRTRLQARKAFISSPAFQKGLLTKIKAKVCDRSQTISASLGEKAAKRPLLQHTLRLCEKWAEQAETEATADE